jgi:D-ribose pyranose/furanose isomerase RbsD
MRSDRIIHPELVKALAECGHGDLILVTDAGFPIPKGPTRIDLGFYNGKTDVLDILKMLRKEMFFENISFAPEVKTHHPVLYQQVQSIFTGYGADFTSETHETLVADVAPFAKVIIRSGSLNAWANFAMTCATDPFGWFNETDITILDTYINRRKMIKENHIPTLGG